MSDRNKYFLKFESVCSSQQPNIFYVTAIIHQFPDPVSDPRSLLLKVELTSKGYQFTMLLDGAKEFTDHFASFNCMTNDPSGNVYIGEDDCAIKYDGTNFEIQNLLKKIKGTLLSVYAPDSSNVYYGTADAWIGHFDANGFNKTQLGPEVDKWDPIDQIHGINNNFIVAVGGTGKIIKCINGEWEHIPAPSNVDLRAVWCESEKEIYIGGQKGHVWRWDGDGRWEPLHYESSVTTEKLICLQFEKHDGVLYAVCGDNGLCRVEGNKLIPIPNIKFVGRVASTNVGLIGVSGKWGENGNWLTRFDGKTWTTEQIKLKSLPI